MTAVLVWLNSLANVLGRVVLAPIAMLPDWLALTLVAIIIGILMLLVFKYTSNQRAIKRVRDDIKANLLALSLFKDNIAVSLRAQGRLLWGAFRLLALAIVPLLVMLLPMSLLLAQLALWYQARPLRVGEDVVITVQLSGDAEAPWPEVRLDGSPAYENQNGPVRIQTRRQLCWKLQAREPGYHAIHLQVDGQQISKELAVGECLMRVSPLRPDRFWSDVLLYPWERPFPPDSLVQSISIQYEPRSSWTAGSKTWLITLFCVSLIAALSLRKVFNVNL